MMLAGLAWLTFLWPPLADHLSPWNRAIGAFGEFSLTLWLLIKGVDARLWNEQASASLTR